MPFNPIFGVSSKTFLRRPARRDHLKRNAMKKYLLSLVFAFCAFGLAQAQTHPDQNPRAQRAYEKYAQQVDSTHAASLGATIDQTYEAHDPMQIREERREERRDFRRQLRLERARRPVIAQPRRFGRYYDPRWDWNW